MTSEGDDEKKVVIRSDLSTFILVLMPSMASPGTVSFWRTIISIVRISSYINCHGSHCQLSVVIAFHVQKS